MNTPSRQATLTLYKPETLPFQEVHVYREGMRLIARETLTEARPEFTLKVAPGRYLVTGMTPSGSRVRETVEVSAGQQKELGVHGEGRSSPHEWLSEMTERQLLPESDIALSAAFAHGIPTRSVETLRGASPMASFSLPILDRLNTTRQVAEDIDRLVQRRSRPSSRTLRNSDVSIRSYVWSREKLRWLRSELIDRAQGEYSPDFTRLVFPSRWSLNGDLAESIHLIGAFQPGLAARYLALPLFSEGSQLVMSLQFDPDRIEKADDIETQPRMVSWRIAAQDPEVDALLQSLTGRAFGDRHALGEGALAVADRRLRDKRQDPVAAVVAGFFLLQYRELDRRAQWVKNLANWFPWSPDALVLGAWGSLLFSRGEEADARSRMAAVYRAGPPQLQPARRILRDLLSLELEDEVAAPRAGDLSKLWKRLGRESRREVQGGPFYSFSRRH